MKLKQELVKYNFQYSDDQIGLLEQYLELFIEKNKVMNLSAIRDEEGVITKHFIDSLLIGAFSEVSKYEEVLDLGTGGGFPGVPLLLTESNIKVTFMDSVAKKLNFIEESLKSMHIGNASFKHIRAEDAGRQDEMREKYDLVLTRAVAFLPTLAEYALPLVKVGGYFIAAKVARDGEELEQSKKVINMLGGKIDRIEKYKLDGSDETRQVIVVKKLKETSNKFPRRVGTPLKSPIL